MPEIKLARLALLVFVLAVLTCACERIAPPPPPAAARTGAAPPAPAGTLPPGGSSTTGLPNFSHIMLIVMENKEAGDVIGSAQAPYINRLAGSYGRATSYYAVAHPSLPNYLALLAGGTLGVTSDCANCLQRAPNLADQLDAHGRSWKAYMEDLPRPCFLGVAAGQYARKHNPWLYFTDIRSSAERCSRVVPLNQLGNDLALGNLPDFAWVTPNLCHDMHDCSVQAGDAWLASFLPALLASPSWQQGGVIFITWDEGSSDAGCCAAGGGGLVPLLVIAPGMRAGFRVSTPLTHYSLLRTIEDAWSLGELGLAASPQTPTLAGFFSP